MKTVYKYSFQIGDIIEISMPINSKILYINSQREVPCIWVLVDKDEGLSESRKFAVHGTGHPINPNISENYIGSFFLHDKRELIFHLFEIK